MNYFLHKIVYGLALASLFCSCVATQGDLQDYHEALKREVHEIAVRTTQLKDGQLSNGQYVTECDQQTAGGQQVVDNVGAGATAWLADLLKGLGISGGVTGVGMLLLNIYRNRTREAQLAALTPPSTTPVP